MTRSIFALLAVSLLAASARAGKYNPVLDIGDDAPAWTALSGVDGKKHSLAALKNKDVVVLVFTCNSCPYAVDYESRLIAFAKKYAGDKVTLVAVNVNKVEQDSLPAMKKRAKMQKFNFAYLYDETQKIAHDYGATYTPEFFVLNKQRKIAYMGAMDDNPNVAKVTKLHLETAVEALLDGKTPEVTETAAVGCLVRYERRRRKKN
ncbi:MAG: thioredoxin family protein [Pirellulales bacterium]